MYGEKLLWHGKYLDEAWTCAAARCGVHVGSALKSSLTRDGVHIHSGLKFGKVALME